MKSLADGLPPELAAQVSPEWRKNEQEYWAVREQLLEQYRGQWVGFAGGKVVASGRRPVTVFHEAVKAASHPYFACVGREHEPRRIRRASFAYDTGYLDEALPIVRVEFRPMSGVPGLSLDRVVADTGADATILPLADCQQLQLDLTQGIPGVVGGVTGDSAPMLGFTVWAFVDGNEYSCQLHADPLGTERILGRDVLNSLDVLFRGPAGEVVINP